MEILAVNRRMSQIRSSGDEAFLCVVSESIMFMLKKTYWRDLGSHERKQSVSETKSYCHYVKEPGDDVVSFVFSPTPSPWNTRYPTSASLSAEKDKLAHLQAFI